MKKAVCGRLFDARGFLGEGCLVLSNGIISDIRKLPPNDVEKVYNFNKEGLVITPAFIDLHVHLRGLKLSYKEDEGSGTKAALLNGILAVMDMPNTLPRLDKAETFEEKVKSFEDNGVVDFGVYAAIPSNQKDLERLKMEPLAGFKIYPEDLERRYDIIKLLKDFDKVIVLHPELPEALQPVVEDEVSRSLHRGCHYETVAVQYVKRILGKVRLHVTHASCPSTVLEAKRLGLTVDVTPHHVFYTARRGCLWRVAPPLRNREIQTSLLNLLLFENVIDAMVSDHAPHKLSERKDPISCSSGFAWLEGWPWLVFRLVSLGVLSLEKFLNLLSFGPARILGLDKRLGLLKKGYRANVIVIDTNYRWRFPGPIASKDPHLHLFMRELRGGAIAAFLGGEEVFLDDTCDCRKALKVKVNLFKS